MSGVWFLAGSILHPAAEVGQPVICREWENAQAFVKDQRPALVILDIRIGGEERGWTILNMLTLDPETRPIR